MLGGDKMLTNRQNEILKIIVLEYIKLAKPVSSNLICDELNCSSATVRSEMASLEELGLLEKTHTSSGRVPSEAGYRYYVDNLMELKKMSAEDMLKLQIIFKNNQLELDDCIKKSLEIISDITSYASVKLGKTSHDNRLKEIQTVPLDNDQMIVIVITDKGYVEHKKITEAFNKNYKSAKKLNIFTSSDINKIIAEGKINDIITLNEVIANNELLDLASQIAEKKDKVKVVLIAGPSSSGKTTTSRKLSMFLNTFGLNPKPLSLDDYFLPREKTPKLPNGDYDFESLRAIDIDLFNNQLRKLLNNEEVIIPTFNFKTGIPEFNKSLKLNENDIIIIEGLHCLNEELTKSIPRENKYKVYVSPLTDLNIDDYNMVSTSDNRLLRRIVRDNRTRGYTACHTIKTWDRVRDGEEKYIFPYQEEADFVFNSALIYEIGALRQYAEPLLYNIDINSPYYEEARRLLRFLNMFLVVPTENIPKESILREFIGGSYFE